MCPARTFAYNIHNTMRGQISIQRVALVEIVRHSRLDDRAIPGRCLALYIDTQPSHHKQISSDVQTHNPGRRINTLGTCAMSTRNQHNGGTTWCTTSESLCVHTLARVEIGGWRSTHNWRRASCDCQRLNEWGGGDKKNCKGKTAKKTWRHIVDVFPAPQECI